MPIDPKAEREVLTQDLITSLRETPFLWRWDSDLRYSIRHQSGVKVWIATGEFRVEEPRRVQFGWEQWFSLRRAFRKWRRVHGSEVARHRDVSNALLVLSTLRGEQPLRRAA